MLRSADLDLLFWLAEQYAARVDQLAVLLGCSPRTVQRVVARLRGEGLVQSLRILADEPAWVTPTARGLRACASPFGVWRPRLDLVCHVAAVNDVRLHIQRRDPDAVWVSERELAKEHVQRTSGTVHLPDGFVLTAARRVAVEVELTVKSRKRLVAILDAHSAAYDAVLYFCAPAPWRVLGELRESGRWPALGIRELPSLDGEPA